MFIGCSKGVNKDTNKLESIAIGLPYIYDDITKFITINVLLHAIMLYNKLGKKYTFQMCEYDTMEAIDTACANFTSAGLYVFAYDCSPYLHAFSCYHCVCSARHIERTNCVGEFSCRHGEI